MNTCEFSYISRRNNVLIQTKGVEKTWPELQREFNRSGPGFTGATYYKTISDEGPQLFAVVNKKWVLYHENNKWHRYNTACNLKFDEIQDRKRNLKQTIDELDDESWVIVTEKDDDTVVVDR